MNALRTIVLILLVVQVPFLFAAGLIAYENVRLGKATLSESPGVLALNYWYILRGELMLLAAALPLVLLGWLLWKLAKWAAKPRPYAAPGSSSSSSYSSSSSSYRTHRRAPSHYGAAASAGASAYVAQSTASAAAPDYFADDPAPSSSAPDYFAGPDDSYDTSSGGAGFDSKDDNSGTW